ncbi:DUF2163 domain-containing protein [Pseudoruegeria sp. SK021]|uniref:DUF2163 domain-containing protein n=1 Tax=Pseudoruegeria sp. SK021 TaxID=1933035 RepID=UPI000A23B23A|nr:DUF2163 domain-containing protein [Pseudoruegeria sp. SK021]OSP54337.1 hypothetical protein BV911_13280 [Pseudoruegeria sp. SK021]
MAISPELQAHLDQGATSLCRCWVVRRKDGHALGFTDHDRPLVLAGMVFKADTGLTAHALQQTTGLSIDNSEAMGALSDAAITEADITAGRYDGAEVETWLVNWNDPEQRYLLFRGTLGDVQIGGGAFRAELRGLTEKLNQQQGRTYQALCGAGLGDAACGVDTTSSTFSTVATVSSQGGSQVFTLVGAESYQEGWFERGSLKVLSGSAAGLLGQVKFDRRVSAASRITLWQDLREVLVTGDQVRLTAGCDKRLATCQQKFGNLLNFRGFPNIPGEDWMLAYPRSKGKNNGGSRYQ